MLDREWYPERYVVQHLNLEPVFGWRIREEGTLRVVARELIRPDANEICVLHNEAIKIKA